jgi:hypothetical protein
MDLEKYFDSVNQSKLVEVLSRTVKDGRVISLIHKYLKAGVVVKHRFEETEVGVPHLLQKQKECQADTRKHTSFHREEAITQGESGENGGGRSKESQISWNEKRRSGREAKTLYRGMGKLFQNSEYEATAPNHRRMDEKTNSHDLLETMERVRTRFKMLQTFGIHQQKAWEYANTRKSYWRTSNSPILSISLGNNTIKGLGFLFFSEYYRQVTA